MKMVALILFLLAQNATTPTKDVTLKMSVSDQAYCQGPTGPAIQQAHGPDDIILSVALKVYYVNHRPEKLVLPGPFGSRLKTILAGQNTPIIERIVSGGSKDPNAAYFEMTTVDGRPGNGPELLQCLSSSDLGCSRNYIYIPVLDRVAGLDLRGKTVQVVLTRDHVLPPDAVEKLKAKLKTADPILSATVESEPLTIHIPSEPSTRDCRAIPLSMK
jgi:hypothetical protein